MTEERTGCGNSKRKYAGGNMWTRKGKITLPRNCTWNKTNSKEIKLSKTERGKKSLRDAFLEKILSILATLPISNWNFNG